ncbi:MAG: GDYXXLXY domain-containing protein [Planctomyces sp.]|nr:GDYXXLXY domain-containing protein [Planctomyces sp.]
MLPSFRQSVVRRPAAVIIAIAVFETIGVILLLSGVVGTRIRGKSVVMKVTCLNPDRFTDGNKVLLTYPFSSPVPSDLGPPDSAQSQQEIYVRLQRPPGSPHHQCAEITPKKPASGLFLKGRTTRDGFPQFGIEEVTVPEDTKQVFQQAVAEDRLCVEITIDHSGQAVLRRLLIHE